MLLENFFRKNNFLRSIDLLVFLYFFSVSSLILLSKDISKFYFIFIYMLLVFLLFYFLKFVSSRENNKFLKFIKYLYPIFLYIYLYKSIDPIMLSINNNWMDKYINVIEFFIFGNEPTILLERIVNPFLTEILKFAYFSYYFIIFVPPVYFYFSKKYRILDEYVESVSIAFFICYIFFILFPVEGPRYVFSELYKVKLDGYFFTRLQDFIMAHVSTHGGCMPSSHVAASCMAWRVINRHFKKTSYFLLILIVLLCFSTVYHRYHYVMDVIGGLVVVYFASRFRIYFLAFYNKYKFYLGV